jgi:hypothetical protein
LEVSSRKLQVDLIAIVAYMSDLENGLGAWDRDLVANPWHGRWLRGSDSLVGFSHDLVSLTEKDANDSLHPIAANSEFQGSLTL